MLRSVFALQAPIGPPVRALLGLLLLSSGLFSPVAADQPDPNANVDKPATVIAEPDFASCMEVPDQFVCTPGYLACRESGKDYWQCREELDDAGAVRKAD